MSHVTDNHPHQRPKKPTSMVVWVSALTVITLLHILNESVPLLPVNNNLQQIQTLSTSPPKHSISLFLNTFAHDAGLLPWLFRSIEEFFVPGSFSELVVTVPLSEKHLLSSAVVPRSAKVYADDERLGAFNDTSLGYLWMQYVRLHADLFTSPDSEFIMILESDSVFVKPDPISLVFQNTSQPHLLIQPLRLYPKDSAGRFWAPGTEFALGRPIEYNFMCSLAVVYPRTLFPKLRHHLETVHGMPLKELILKHYVAGYLDWDPNLKVPRLSEYNIMTGFAYYFLKDEFVFVEDQKQFVHSTSHVGAKVPRNYNLSNPKMTYEYIQTAMKDMAREAKRTVDAPND